jgi:septal ring factor EnvC (AmiA/AmiB activator)
MGRASGASALPPPERGRVGEGVAGRIRGARGNSADPHDSADPHPNPPPEEGGGSLTTILNTRRIVCAVLVLSAAIPASPPAVAQDIPGIELCTREQRLDRRTGCLQSNVEYLQQLIAKNSLDTQQRVAAANREIAAQKDQLAAATREIAALKDALAELQNRADQAPAAVAARELAALRDAVRDLRAHMDEAQKAKPK